MLSGQIIHSVVPGFALLGLACPAFRPNCLVVGGRRDVVGVVLEGIT